MAIAKHRTKIETARGKEGIVFSQVRICAGFGLKARKSKE